MPTKCGAFCHVVLKHFAVTNVQAVAVLKSKVTFSSIGCGVRLSVTQSSPWPTNTSDNFQQLTGGFAYCLG